jgi:ribonuclease P protein component
MCDQSFPLAYRLRRNRDFERVYRRRRAAGDECLLVFGAYNGLSHTRIGMAVPRKVGRAVVRNRWKRLVREAFRLQRQKLPTGIDLVVVVRGQKEPTLAIVTASLLHLVNRVEKKLRQ